MMAVPDAAPALEVEALSVRFGGLVAVDNVSLHAPGGAITGLIGPNGAGKTTIFNACTGLVRPSAGSVRLAGRCLDGRTPARRAQWGLGRTFQRMQIFDTMTVAENVALGPECRLAGATPWAQLRGSRRSRSECLMAADDAMARCGIEHLADRPAAELSTGHRRLLELARAVACRFRFVLLDEPSSGLDVDETERFGRVLLELSACDELGILLVEHDMSLVRQVCSSVYVLDFGRMIFHGPTAEVLTAEVVRDAYLGTGELELT
jgi:ABC-type branched-subunit amino acid transport system ATPase component